ncbi:hypothetical protein ACFLYD_06470 [Chloroflexota bacterium]
MSQDDPNGKSKLEQLVDDLAELEVITLQGGLTAVVSSEAGHLIDWTELLKNAKTTGEVKLVAATHIKIDGDTQLFVATNAPESLKKAHLEATAAAQEYRSGLVRAFADMLGSIIPSA